MIGAGGLQVGGKNVLQLVLCIFFTGRSPEVFCKTNPSFFFSLKNVRPSLELTLRP